MEIQCPKCGHDSVKRVMDTVVIDEAKYVEDLLEITEVNFDVRESYIKCGNPDCTHTFEDDEEKYEELFL